MEEDQELKHVCKFCNKNFPCGRSLGGHMRSHVTNNVSTETEKFATTKKLSSLNKDNGGDNTGTGSEAGTNAGYGIPTRLGDSQSQIQVKKQVPMLQI